MTGTRLRTVLAAILAGALAAGGTTSVADDTEIFLGGRDSVVAGGRPNVLFVIDSSRSMLELSNPTSEDAAKTRIAVLREAMNIVLDDIQNVNVGLMRFTNPGGAVLYPISPIDGVRGGQDVRQQLKDTIRRLNYDATNMDPVGATPIASTVYEAALYLRGLPVDFGRRRNQNTAAPNPNANTVISHPSSYTGGSLGPDGIFRRITGDAKYIAPQSDACQANYVVLLSDGAPNNDLGLTNGDLRNKVRQLTGAACADRPGRPNEVCGRELVNFLGRENSGTRPVQVFTVGFNLDPAELASGAADFLQALAAAGEGTAAGKGEYFPANSVDDLVNALQGIFTDIVAKPASFSAPATTVNAFNRLQSGLDVYLTLFKPSPNVAWRGNLKKYTICSQAPNALERNCQAGKIVGQGGTPITNVDGTPNTAATDFFASGVNFYSGSDLLEAAVVNGGAASQMPAHPTRNVLTYTGGYPVTSGAAASEVSADNEGLTKAMLLENGATLTQAQVDAAMSDQQRAVLIDWIRGRDVDDADGDGNRDEDRYAFGDPLHTSAVVVNYGGTERSPVQAAFLPTNDGGLRMLNATSGEEVWAWVPQELLAIQQRLRVNGAALPKRVYGLDATPTVRVRDANNNGVIEPAQGDFVHLFFGMRDGGRNYYALDVTPSGAGTLEVEPRLLWVIRGGEGEFADLMNTWSEPTLANIKVDEAQRTVVVFGGGHDPALDRQFGPGAGGNVVYLVDALTGELVTSIGGSETAARLPVADMDFPVPSAISIFSSSGQGFADRMYFGDLGGQVWRVDLQPTLASGATGSGVGVASKLAALAQASGETLVNHGSDTRKFYNAPAVVAVRGRFALPDQPYDLVLIGSGTRPNPRNAVTHDRFYALRDYRIGSLTAGVQDGTYPLTSADEGTRLVDVTSSAIQANLDGGAQSGSGQATPSPALNGSFGWFIDLHRASEPGEKVLSRASVVSGKLFFTTYVPEDNETLQQACQLSEGKSYLWGLNVLTGIAFVDYADEAVPGAEPVAVGGRRLAGPGLVTTAPVVVVNLGEQTVIGQVRSETGELQILSRQQVTPTYWNQQ